MIDERRTANMRDRVKTSITHSKMEIISLNGEVKSKIKQVVVDRRRTRNKLKLKEIKSDKKDKRIFIRDTCINNSV